MAAAWLVFFPRAVDWTVRTRTAWRVRSLVFIPPSESRWRARARFRGVGGGCLSTRRAALCVACGVARAATWRSWTRPSCSLFLLRNSKVDAMVKCQSDVLDSGCGTREDDGASGAAVRGPRSDDARRAPRAPEAAQGGEEELVQRHIGHERAL